MPCCLQSGSQGYRSEARLSSSHNLRNRGSSPPVLLQFFLSTHLSRWPPSTKKWRCGTRTKMAMSLSDTSKTPTTLDRRRRHRPVIPTKAMAGLSIAKRGSECELPTTCLEPAANQAQRLFGFAQIFAFSLTFMSTWEGMCTYASPIFLSPPRGNIS
jgi:hypothetical protein